MNHGCHIRRPVPVFALTMRSPSDDIFTIKNLAKLDAAIKLLFCKTMDLLTYSYAAGGKQLTEWLIRHGLTPEAQYTCEPGTSGVKQWVVTTKEIQTVFSQ